MKPPFSNNQLNCSACPFLLTFNKRVLSFSNPYSGYKSTMNRKLTHELPPIQNAQSGSIPLGKRHTWTPTNPLKANPGHQKKTTTNNGGKTKRQHHRQTK